MKLKGDTLLRQSLIILILLNSSLYKVLGVSYDFQLWSINILFACIGLLYVYIRNSRYFAARYCNKIVIFIIFLNLIEIIYTQNRYEFYSFRNWVNSIGYVMLFVGIAPIIIYLIEKNILKLRKLLKYIVVATTLSYLIRIFIRYIYTRTGRLILSGIALECASSNWVRRGMLRINPPCFAIVVVPINIYLLMVSKQIKDKISNIISIIIAIYYSYAVHMSRSMFLYQIIIVFFCFLLPKKETKKSLNRMLIILVSIVIACNFGLLDQLFSMIDSLLNLNTYSSYGSTTIYRLNALEYYYSWMKENIILGIGILTNSQLTSDLTTGGHISDIGFMGNIFRFGILGIILEIFTLGRMVYITIILMKKKYRKNPLSILVSGICISTILTSINIDCFYYLYVFAFPFSLAIVEFAFLKLKRIRYGFECERYLWIRNDANYFLILQKKL